MSKPERKENLILLILHLKPKSKGDPSEIRRYLLNTFLKEINQRGGDSDNVISRTFALTRLINKDPRKATGVLSIYEYKGNEFYQIVELIREICQRRRNGPPGWVDYEIYTDFKKYQS